LLRSFRDFIVSVVRFWCKCVKPGSHIEKLAVQCRQAEIDGYPSGMWRPSPGVCEKFWVRCMVPQNPLRFRRSKSVVNSYPITKIGGRLNRPFQRTCGFRMQIANCILVYWLTRKVFRCGISQRYINVKIGCSNFNQVHWREIFLTKIMTLFFLQMMRIGR